MGKLLGQVWRGQKDKAPGARQAPGADGGKQERKVWVRSAQTQAQLDPAAGQHKSQRGQQHGGGGRGQGGGSRQHGGAKQGRKHNGLLVSQDKRMRPVRREPEGARCRRGLGRRRATRMLRR